MMMISSHEDHTPLSREVLLTIGAKPEDTILEALKEGEAMVWVTCATGQEPPESLNQGMEDLLKLNKIASATKTDIIPPRSNKIIQAHTPLILMGTKKNVMTEPLH